MWNAAKEKAKQYWGNVTRQSSNAWNKVARRGNAHAVVHETAVHEDNIVPYDVTDSKKIFIKPGRERLPEDIGFVIEDAKGKGLKRQFSSLGKSVMGSIGRKGKTSVAPSKEKDSWGKEFVKGITNGDIVRFEGVRFVDLSPQKRLGRQRKHLETKYVADYQQPEHKTGRVQQGHTEQQPSSLAGYPQPLQNQRASKPLPSVPPKTHQSIGGEKNKPSPAVPSRHTGQPVVTVTPQTQGWKPVVPTRSASQSKDTPMQRRPLPPVQPRRDTQPLPPAPTTHHFPSRASAQPQRPWERPNIPSHNAEGRKDTAQRRPSVVQGRVKQWEAATPPSRAGYPSSQAPQNHVQKWVEGRSNNQGIRVY